MCFSVFVLIAWIPPRGFHWQAYIKHPNDQMSFPRLFKKKKKKLSTSDGESQLNEER